MTWCSGFTYFGFRTLVVIVFSVIAYIVPNINILLVTGGSIFGTTINIVMPVLFYNRAYARTEKNMRLEGSVKKEEEVEIEEKEQDGKAEEEEPKDPRQCVKIFSWITFVVGLAVGIDGLVYVIM